MFRIGSRNGALNGSDPSYDYRRALELHAMIASMSRKADCLDNAVAESFFATLRAELVDDERYATRQAAELSIGDYIERFYNVERLHSHLEYVSPIEFEVKARVAAIAAQSRCPPKRVRIIGTRSPVTERHARCSHGSA